MPTIADVRAQFPQYSDMSDSDLASALHQKFYTDMPKEEFEKKLGLKSEPKSDVTTDVAKSGGIGIARGLVGLAGLPGTVEGLIGRGVRALGDKIGLPEPPSDAMPRQMFPSAEHLTNTIEGVTGKFYEPKTTAGEYARTVGEFAPAALGGGTGLLPRAGQVLIPALASETAGQAARQLAPAAEPYARLGAAILGGAPSIASSAITASKSAPVAQAIKEVKDAASAGYKSPEVAALTFKPGAVDQLATSIESTLQRAKANERLAPQTNALIDEMRVPVNGPTHTYEDLQTTRELLGKQAANFANPQEQRAASIAMEELTKYIDAIPQSHLLSGDAVAAGKILANARGDYASAKTAEKVADKIYNAEVQTGSTYSGGNLNNATRQKLRPLLTSPKQGRGLTDSELAQIEELVTGSQTGNAFRSVGKFLGGGGGMGLLHSSLAGGGAGAMMGGPGGALAGMIIPGMIGYGTKKVGDAITRTKANSIVQEILARSPTGQAGGSPMLQTLAAAPNPRVRELVLNALLTQPSTFPPAR